MSRLSLRAALVAGAVSLVVAATASSASAVVIDFGSTAAGAYPVLQFPTATFTSASAYVFVDASPGFPQSHFLDSADNTKDLIVRFTNPVSNLAFYALGVNANGRAAAIDVFDAKNRLLGTAYIRGVGNGGIPVFTDLSQFRAVSRIRTHVDGLADPSGIAYDTFSFTVDGTSPKPKPPKTPKHG
jgi:hypothetical protein